MLFASFQTLLFIALWLVPPVLLCWLGYFLVSLPMRRNERARLFIDVIELGLKDGRTPEQTVISIAAGRDLSMGVRFHLLAAHVESGVPLGDALDRVPRFLPPSIRAMLKTGHEIGDLSKVFPACRQHLKDGVSRTRGALNYLVVLALVLTPAVPAIALTVLTFVFPKLLAILQEMEVAPPAFTSFVLASAHLFVPMLFILTVVLYLITFIYVGGPRLTTWLRWGGIPLGDRMAFHLPWRRKQLQRDFVGLLGALLDANVAEERAVALAAAGTANAIVELRAGDTVSDLRVGVKLPQSIHRLDDSGEFRWRLANASQSLTGFRSALNGWLEALDAKAFQQQQAAAHLITTTFVLVNGVLIGGFVIGTFDVIIAILNNGVLW